jgi:hypothetical protein
MGSIARIALYSYCYHRWVVLQQADWDSACRGDFTVRIVWSGAVVRKVMTVRIALWPRSKLIAGERPRRWPVVALFPREVFAGGPSGQPRRLRWLVSGPLKVEQR